jgi:DNA polymerase III subunit chi
VTQVDFYVLDSPSADRHDRMICRIVEKAFQQGHSVYIHCENADLVRAIDDMLWRFKDVSFVPHAVETDDKNTAPVALGTAARTTGDPDVLVNLCNKVPESASSYARIIETAGYDEASRSAARKRYRHYKEQSIPLNTHKVSG